MARPKKYQDANVFQQKVDEYFNMCDEKNKPYTICGLALYLDLDRKSLLNYSKDEDFFHIIKKAKLKVEMMLEEQLYRLGNNSGIIFNLKNNFGWVDKIEDTENEEAITNASDIIVKIRKTVDDRYERS